MKFIEQLTAYIEEHLNPRHLTIVLPSERAKKYIAASWYSIHKKPVWLPEMITIDQLVRKHANFPIIDKTRALIELYAIHCEVVEIKEQQSFDDFLSWGGMLLSDFDEIDRYCVDPKQLFRNLSDVKEIENWSFSSEKPLTEQQKKFMEFWDLLPVYFKQLNENLEKKGLQYAGKAYRELADQPERLFSTDAKRQFIFAGFNALSKAELKLFKQLHVLGRGHILIDADSYYVHSKQHEAGMFIRSLMDELGVKSLPFIQNELTVNEKVIHTIECPQHTGQVKAVATLLSKLSAEELNDTLVLLADETLINPLLKNIPKQVGTANVTLGLPLQYTALRTWVDMLFSVQESKRKFNTKSLYVHDLRKIWRHPFIHAVLSEKEKKACAALEQKMIAKNSLFINPENINAGETHNELIKLISTDWNSNWVEAMRIIRLLNNFLHERMLNSTVFERAVVQRFDEVIRDFQLIVQEGLPDSSLRTFKQLFHQHWSGKSLAFHGSPLKGLQLMGLLETRLLDFKRIYVVGMNEGKMPPTNPLQSMIPMDLRAFFKMPTPREKQGLFAHHFYRLLHGCEEMWVTYTTAKENIGSNEASRYLKQIELELCRESHVKMKKWLYSIPTSESSYGPVEITKNEEVLAKIEQFLTTPLSASKVMNYLNCPLNFYYRYILDFGEEDTIEEEIENNRFGTFIHNVLEKLYLPYARHDKSGKLIHPAPKNLAVQDVDKMLMQFPGLIEEEFLTHFDKDKTAFESGKNLLSFQMANELTKRILLKEREFISQLTEPLFIEYVEFTMEAEMEIEINGESRKIQLKGIADRIDSYGDQIRVIDYKSGVVKTDHVELGEFKEGQDILSYVHSTKHALQLLMYLYLYREMNGVIPSQAAIYSMVSIKDGVLPLRIKNEGDLGELVNRLPEFFESFISALLQSDEPLTHKEDAKFCQFCQ